MTKIITPKSDASLRTKNILRNHGSDMVLEDGPKAVDCFEGERGLLFRAPDGWFGWLLESEIDMEDFGE